MLIGPLVHIKVWNAPLKAHLWAIDWSRPGAVERYNDEWDREFEYLHSWQGKYPGP